MVIVLKNMISQDKIALAGITLLFCLLLSLNLPFNQKINDLSQDLLYQMRGPRTVSDNIIFLYIGQEDIQSLGGWPIPRDYYAYLLHHLKQQGVKTVGIDILFEKPDQQYSEYDKMLEMFIQQAGNVVLPFTFSELRTIENPSEDQRPQIGINPTFPMNRFASPAAGIGFSNLGMAAFIRKVPVVALYGGSYHFSFGTELARIFLNLPPESFIAGTEIDEALHMPIPSADSWQLNHFGSVDKISSFSFLSFLSALEEKSNTLNLKDKMVIVGVTAPGKSTTVATPLVDALPATLIHFTLAENIIQNNFIRNLSLLLQWIIIFLLILGIWVLWRLKKQMIILIASIFLLTVYWIISLILFIKYNLVSPFLYPSIAVLISYLYMQNYQKQKRTRTEHELKSMLEEQISKKEKEIIEAQEKLTEYQTQVTDQEKQSQEIMELAEERKRAILRMESELRDLNVYAKSEAKSEVGEEFGDIIHAPESKLKEVLELIHRIRTDDIPVLIMGETGSGKEIIARAIHRTGVRSDKPFIAINCGALTETLLESELFGHEKGSFTGASARRRGRFELANGGTIFLDEITETSPAFQAKLLRVLQEGVFERVGGEESLKVDVRIIAASNRDIQVLVDNETFRSDLFYRLNGFLIRIPALRERPEDIPLLAAYFLKKYDYQPVGNFSSQVMDILKNYSWPGNVRELENVIRRAAIMAKSEKRELIRLSDLSDDLQQSSLASPDGTIYQSLEDQILASLRALEFSHSSISQSAKALGNKDRGTITEYYRGICFNILTQHNFKVEESSVSLAANEDPEVIERVKKKMNDYIKNLYPLPDLATLESEETQKLPQFKGLPKKYHEALKLVIQHLQKNKDMD
jgi:transcriptional regulator with GAF, ATPase, and Fis domain/CHASE2 domain-containing sensor protein